MVEDSVYDEFVEKSVERAKKRVVGDPFKVMLIAALTRSIRENILKNILFKPTAIPPTL